MGAIVFGVDPAATHLAGVFLGGPKSYEYAFTRTPSKVSERCVYAYEWMHEQVAKYAAIDRVVLAMETPLLHGQAKGTGPQTVVRGALIAGAMMAGAETLLDVHNMTWKARVVGNGHASKADIAGFVKTTWPELWNDVQTNVASAIRQDVFDAGCIAIHGTNIMRVRDKLSRRRSRSAH